MAVHLEPKKVRADTGGSEYRAVDKPALSGELHRQEETHASYTVQVEQSDGEVKIALIRKEATETNVIGTDLQGSTLPGNYHERGICTLTIIRDGDSIRLLIPPPHYQTQSDPETIAKPTEIELLQIRRPE